MHLTHVGAVFKTRLGISTVLYTPLPAFHLRTPCLHLGTPIAEADDISTLR